MEEQHIQLLLLSLFSPQRKSRSQKQFSNVLSQCSPHTPLFFFNNAVGISPYCVTFKSEAKYLGKQQESAILHNATEKSLSSLNLHCHNLVQLSARNPHCITMHIDKKINLETARPMQSQLCNWTLCRQKLEEVFIVIKKISVLKYPFPFEKMFHPEAQIIRVFTNRNTICSCTDQTWHIILCHSDIKLKTFSLLCFSFSNTSKTAFKKVP